MLLSRVIASFSAGPALGRRGLGSLCIRAAVGAIALAVALSAMSGPVGAQNQTDYTLVAGDEVKITVFGEPELSGQFEIDSTGALAFPLIGAVSASGVTARGLEAEIDARLRDGYIINPQVNVEIISYRPYFVMGEVNSPGKYEYRPQLSVIRAIAIAGDFTPRADKRDIHVTRGGEGGQSFEADASTIVMPGDIVEVRERLF